MKKKDFLLLLQSMNIGEKEIEKIAINCSFMVRKGLVSPADLLYAICCQSTQGTVSFNDLAAKIDAENSISVSRQAIAKKVNKQSALAFLQKILSLVIMSKMDKELICSLRNTCKYKRILVQDSTILALPIRLFDIFSGVSNGHCSVCNARIQCVYDLIAENFISFTIDTYTKNDLKAAPELQLEPGDMVIRDRGYWSFSEVQRHLSIGADCIYRYKKCQFLDVVTGVKINLLERLKADNKLDLMVKLPNEESTIVRLIAFPVSEAIANNRRMKAKKEMKSTPTKEMLELLSWSIFVTTIPETEADYDFIFKAYSLRWRIEIIFKAWKSNMEFSKIHNVSQKQLSIILFARFIMIIICIQYIYAPARQIIRKLDKYLSLIKLVRYLMKNPVKILQIVRGILNFKGKIDCQILSMAKYCCYEKRKRKNFESNLDQILFLS